jgi:hypothetical protein
MAYNAVDPACQGQGLGRIMIEARKEALLQLSGSHKKELGGIFVECNDPAKIKPEDDVMDPAKRIAMFEGMGARMISIDYIQPPLAHGAEKCDTIRLLAYPHPVTGLYPSKDEIKDYLTGIYTELAKYAGCLPGQNPDFIKSMQQLDALPDDKLFLPRTQPVPEKKSPPPAPPKSHPPRP